MEQPAYSTAGKTIDQMANDVLAGKVGSGETRAKLLGKFNTSVQAVVNAKLGVITVDSLNNTLANEVKKGVFGTGDTRKKLLATHYNAVQAVINKTTARHTYYTVKAGDSWWLIANKYKINMNTLARQNGKTIKSVIHPGQKLLIR